MRMRILEDNFGPLLATIAFLGFVALVCYASITSSNNWEKTRSEIITACAEAGYPIIIEELSSSSSSGSEIIHCPGLNTPTP